jgi:hypothetical protein
MASSTEKPESPRLGLNLGHQQVTQDADTGGATEKFFLNPKKIRSKIDPVVKIGVAALQRCPVALWQLSL